MKPVDGLLAAATDAALLVVGNRGLGTFGELLVRSASEDCIERAPARSS